MESNYNSFVDVVYGGTDGDEEQGRAAAEEEEQEYGCIRVL